MMHNVLADLNIKALDRYEPEVLQTHEVTAVLLALGSNYHADTYLPIALSRLAELGEIELSTAFQNPDFTATLALPKPDYTNQCAYLALKSPLTLAQLQQTLRQIECDCQRQRLTERSMSIKQVTMDIDILLVNLYTSLYINKNSLSKINISKWIVMANRYPFKTHEAVGIEELVSRRVSESKN
ncbi:2-amino-4-hydroxy-6-hydroxymethyldihydropteridine diphosphokinase [Psychrobacter sp. B38]|uniref:2-amino-4-hydroxy-6- hydroxymethyldihydropteridine diphosphokinase n=1 Tax=Psychrobacter sp. B38 TaxID=3143538 RepID=UPI00320C898F